MASRLSGAIEILNPYDLEYTAHPPLHRRQMALGYRLRISFMIDPPVNWSGIQGLNLGHSDWLLGVHEPFALPDALPTELIPLEVAIGCIANVPSILHGEPVRRGPILRQIAISSLPHGSGTCGASITGSDSNIFK